ncbi:putative ribonuclease H-like domain-containing protein [Tanacetum coccineum]
MGSLAVVLLCADSNSMTSRSKFLKAKALILFYKVMNDFCKEKADSKLPATFWAKADSTACYVQNTVLVVKPHNKTPYEFFIGFKPTLNFMKPFGCHVTILNTLDSLGKFDGKSDEGFFVRYSLSSKAFRVYNTRTRRVEENLHIRFLENKPMIEGNGPKWLFDIDSLTQSMNYVPVAAGTIINESAGTQGEPNVGISEEISQDCIMMPIWKDALYFDSLLKDVDNGEPKSTTDDQKQVEDGPNNENDENDKSDDDSSPKEVNAAGQHVNTASPDVNTDSPKDMFTMGASHTLEATHVEFFSDEDEPKTRRMTKPTSEQGFLSAVEAMQEELMQFKLLQVWILVDLPIGKRAIRTKWVFRNKKDERGIVIRNKARLVAQGHRKEEGIDYEEVFSPVARIEAIRLFLAYAFFMVFLVYVDDIIFGSTNKELCTGFEKLMKDKFQMSSMGELTFFLGLQVQQKEYGIFISGDKYVAEILKKFNYTDVKSASTPIDLEKPLVKYGDANDVDAHLYRSMIGSLMYLTTSRPDIIYLKGKPTLGLWYYRDSPFELVAYTDSDYAGATQDKKSTTKGCQFLGNMLISWQCKKQTMVATSTTEAEYVAAASCYEQVLWIQNQLLDYGYNFMNIVINIDNNSTICIIENPVQHSKTKHIKIGHHFIRDCNAKKLIQMVKIHIDYNVADLLTKGFDVGRHVKRGRDTKIPQSSGPPLKDGDEAIHKEFGDRMERAATTASSFEAEQDSGSGPRCQDTILGDVDAQTRFKTTSKQSNNPPLSRGYTLGSGEDSIKILELMELCTKLSNMLHKNRISDLSEGNEGFHEIIDFLDASHIKYALTKNPTIYVSFIKQFWRTATANTRTNREVKLTATIDRHAKTITEASLRRHLKLEDNDGVTSLPNLEIYEQLALMGYDTDSDKLTFQKGNFSPQWRFLIHTILHCLSPKKTAWEHVV